MPCNHKFQEHRFNNEFQTHNAILDKVPYYPEVIIIGSFNHGWAWNPSDFYYGRNMFMWPILGNLFLNNRNEYIHQRNINHDEPNLNQIFEICKKGKIVFADIVKGINPSIPIVENNDQKCIIVNNQFCWNNYSDKQLEKMATNNWLDDNIKPIIDYIQEQKSIKHIYFTFKSGKWLVAKRNEILKGVQRKDFDSCSIFTPTAQGFLENLEAPFNQRAWSLAHCWVWNGETHQVPINKPGYGHFNHNWLKRNNVEPVNF